MIGKIDEVSYTEEYNGKLNNDFNWIWTSNEF